MQTIVSLDPLYKRDSKGKVRIWTMQVGFNNENEAGIRTISGLVDGQKVTSEWNLTEAKNVGRSNATTAKTQAEFEAQACKWKAILLQGCYTTAVVWKIRRPSFPCSKLEEGHDETFT